MNLDEFRELWNRRPFRRFPLVMADGERVAINHPECVVYGKGTRSVHVIEDDASFQSIDLLLVTRALVSAPQG